MIPHEGEYFAVKIECIRQNEFSECGSGCVLIADSDEYDYVFTALHCLRGKQNGHYAHSYENYEIKIDSKYINEKIIVKDSYPNEEKDIVVIKVDKVNTDRFVTLKSCDKLIGEKVYIPGFPAIYKNDGMTSEAKIKRFKQIEQPRLFFIGVEEQINLSRLKAKEILEGFSGAGVYYQTETCMYLTSVVTDLGDPNFTFYELVSVDISEFETLLENHSLMPVKGYAINSIELYVEKAFNNEENESLMEVLKKKAKEIKVDLNYFVNWLKEKMFIPQAESNYSDEGLWIGWIKFLTFMYLCADDTFFDIDNKCFNEKEFLNYIRSYRDTHIKYFHSYLTKNMADVVYYVCHDDEIFSCLNWGDTIIVNFGKQTPYLKAVLHNEASRIVPSIGEIRNNELYDKGIDISNPESSKSVDYYHINYFEEQMCIRCCEVGLNKTNIENTIKKYIIEVMENVKQKQRKTGVN